MFRDIPGGPALFFFFKGKGKELIWGREEVEEGTRKTKGREKFGPNIMYMAMIDGHTLEVQDK